MKPKELYPVRLEMAKMHDQFINRMSVAYDNQRYVETVWYCYAIFEQRISRLIAKNIDQCNLFPERTDDKSASISIRISCIKKLIEAKYNGFDIMSTDLFSRISKWCNARNDLVHGLISLKHYKQFDNEFETLAKIGVQLVFELYDACSEYRNIWYEIKGNNNPFPVKKCKCKEKKCINPNSI